MPCLSAFFLSFNRLLSLRFVDELDDEQVDEEDDEHVEEEEDCDEAVWEEPDDGNDCNVSWVVSVRSNSPGTALFVELFNDVDLLFSLTALALWAANIRELRRT